MKRSTFLSRLRPTVVFLAASLASSQAFAQAKGDVAIEPSGLTGLKVLAERLAAPRERQLIIKIAPEFSYEKFDSYREDAESTLFGSGEVQSPAFRIRTAGIGARADYLFANNFLLGGTLNYSNADYDFKVGSREELGPGGSLGEPLDRSFQEYDFTIVAGYLKDPWAVLLDGKYGRRHIETMRREGLLLIPGPDADQFLFENKGDTDSDLYAFDLSISYRTNFGNGRSIQNLASIGYRREDIDSYEETLQSLFVRDDFGGPFEKVSKNTLAEDDIIIREFNQQTIESIPLSIGVMFSAEDIALNVTGINFGLIYSHDFDNQKRRIVGRFPFDSVEYEERNRNQDFFSIIGALGFDIAGMRGTFSYQGDVGFDERERADVFSLEIRVPL